MPATIRMRELVATKGTRHLWPTDFIALADGCETDLSDRIPFGVVSDWLRDHGDDDLAEAYRWVFKREKITFSLTHLPRHYMIFGMPSSLSTTTEMPNGVSIDLSTIAGLMASLSYTLDRVREEIA